MMEWDSPVHVFEEKQQSMTMKDERDESQLETRQEHGLLRSDSHEDQPEYSFRDLPVDLPSLSFDSDDVPALSNMYNIQACLLRTPMLSLPMTVPVAATKHQEVNYSLTLEVHDTVPLVTSYFCCLWELTIDVYNLIPSNSYVSIHPGQALYLHLNDPKRCLPPGYFLQVKLTQYVSLFVKKGNQTITENSRILSRNRQGKIVFPKKMSRSHLGRWIQVQHEMVVSLKYKQRVVASTPKIHVYVVP